jgi:branched-chain amino acid transport system substrate-binding protein
VAFGTLLRSVQDAGLNIPIAGGPGNMSYPQMAQYANFLPKVLLFPAASSVAQGGVGPGPIRDAQTVYFNAFKKYAGKPDFLESSVWDAAMLVVEAYRKLGPDATADQFQHYFQTLHGWVGIMGVYDFRDGSQRGIGANVGVVAAWSAAKRDFVVVSKLGGLPK